MVIGDSGGQDEHGLDPSPEAREPFGRTGETAMDAVPVHPFKRVFFGVFAIVLVCVWVEIVRASMRELPFAWNVLWIVVYTIITGRVTARLAAVAIFGKSGSWRSSARDDGSQPKVERE